MKFLSRYYSQLIFLVIGILAGFFISRLPIKFEEKVSWIALANFFLTIGLAIYLEFIVRPSFSNNRNEKDILIEQLKDVKQKSIEAAEIYLKHRSGSPLATDSKSEIIVSLRSLSNHIDLLKQTDEYCAITEKTEMSKRVFKEYLVYKKALTGRNFNDANFSYDRLHWSKTDLAYKNLMKVVMHSIIDINKA